MMDEIDYTIFSREVYMPEFLRNGESEIVFEKKINEETDLFINLYQEYGRRLCNASDELTQNFKKNADQVPYIRNEMKRLCDEKTKLKKELSEIEVTLKDVFEEVELVKTEEVQIEQEIEKKSEHAHVYTEDFNNEIERINKTKENIRRQYNSVKRRAKLYSDLFNCKLKRVNEEDNTMYSLTLKNEIGEDVTVTFETLNQGVTITLLDIQSSPKMDKDFLDTIKNTLNTSQDMQGLLGFLHKTFIL